MLHSDKFLVIPKHTKKSFDANNITIEELAEALYADNTEKLKFITDKVSHSDIRDIISLTSVVLKKLGIYTRVDNSFILTNLSNSIDFNIESPEKYLEDISLSKYEYSEIMNNNVSIEEVLLTLDDNSFENFIFDDFIIAVVDDGFVKELKIKRSITLIKLFANFLNLQSKMYGKDINKSPYVYTFLLTLYNRTK